MSHKCATSFCPSMVRQQGEKCWPCRGWAMKWAIILAREARETQNRGRADAR